MGNKKHANNEASHHSSILPPPVHIEADLLLVSVAALIFIGSVIDFMVRFLHFLLDLVTAGEVALLVTKVVDADDGLLVFPSLDLGRLLTGRIPGGCLVAGKNVFIAEFEALVRLLHELYDHRAIEPIKVLLTHIAE